MKNNEERHILRILLEHRGNFTNLFLNFIDTLKRFIIEISTKEF